MLAAWDRVEQEHKGVFRSKSGERVISDPEPDDEEDGWWTGRKMSYVLSFHQIWHTNHFCQQTKFYVIISAIIGAQIKDN